MTFLKEGKTNWIYILIVVILAVIVGAGILWWVKKQEVPPAEFPEVKKPEEVVEEIICGVSDPLYCKNDQDCICEARGCFMGNKHYHEKCVNKDKLCLDYCGLPGSTIISKCVQNKCNFESKTW
jgi:hypothetical protein